MRFLHVLISHSPMHAFIKMKAPCRTVPALTAYVLWIIVVLLFCPNNVNADAIANAIKESGSEGESSDLSSMYKVAVQWYNEESKRDDAVQVLHHLADTGNHVLSCAKLGHYYANTGLTTRAIDYFKRAGEEGPHHTSLYNAGKLLAEQQGDWVGALAYLKAAATLPNSYPPEYISKETTQSALEAYDIICRQLSRQPLTIVELADVFVFGSLQELKEDAQTLWVQAINGLLTLNQTGDSASDRTKSLTIREEITQALRLLWETYGITGSLSQLQIYLLLDKMNDMLGHLARWNDDYVPMAAGYAEVLATHSVYCWDQYAVHEGESSCFNEAAANAMSYYRRMSSSLKEEKDESTQRVLHAANQHPHAATHWKLVEQTPRIFHPDLITQPWWDETKFSTVTSLMTTFQQSKKVILKDLQAIKNLKESQIQGMHDAPESVEIDALGNTKSSSMIDQVPNDSFIPNMHIRADDAPSWTEFGSLWDGTRWSKRKCELVPSICRALKSDPSSLCTKSSSSSSTNSVSQDCGTTFQVGLVRLRPGTTVLAHCGTTNSRLVMLMALEGANGVEITVSGQTVKNFKHGDGHAVVFDDSFEHSIYHGGKQDLFLVVAVLAHPNL